MEGVPVGGDSVGPCPDLETGLCTTATDEAVMPAKRVNNSTDAADQQNFPNRSRSKGTRGIVTLGRKSAGRTVSECDYLLEKAACWDLYPAHAEARVWPPTRAIGDMGVSRRLVYVLLC